MAISKLMEKTTKIRKRAAARRSIAKSHAQILKNDKISRKSTKNSTRRNTLEKTRQYIFIHGFRSKKLTSSNTLTDFQIPFFSSLGEPSYSVRSVVRPGSQCTVTTAQISQRRHTLCPFDFMSFSNCAFCQPLTVERIIVSSRYMYHFISSRKTLAFARAFLFEAKTQKNKTSHHTNNHSFSHSF